MKFHKTKWFPIQWRMLIQSLTTIARLSLKTQVISGVDWDKIAHAVFSLFELVLIGKI